MNNSPPVELSHEKIIESAVYFIDKAMMEMITSSSYVNPQKVTTALFDVRIDMIERLNDILKGGDNTEIERPNVHVGRILNGVPEFLPPHAKGEE